MPHHLRKSGLLERAAQMAAGTGKRSSDRAAPCKKGRRGGGGARGWAGTGWKREAYSPQDSMASARLKSQRRDPTGQQLTPGGAVMGGPWQDKHVKQAHVPRPPQARLLHPSVRPGSFFFATSCLLAWLSCALQVSGSRTLPLRQSQAQRGKQGGECNASGRTGSGWLQRP